MTEHGRQDAAGADRTIGVGKGVAPGDTAEENTIRGRVSDLSRRTFLRTGAMAAAAAGAVAAVPGLSGLLAGAENDAPALDGAASDAGGAAGLSNLVAHVTNAETGQMSLFLGQREIVVNDPALVRQLARAANK